MTFALVVATPTTIWACADRQLGNDTQPTGVKIAIVGASDGTALLTYAGVGRIERTEVSRWITRTLTNRDWPLEALLKEVASASRKRLLGEAAKINEDQTFIASAFHQGTRRIYIIDKDARITPTYQAKRGIAWEAAGTGRHILEKHFDGRRISILRQIRRCDRGTVSVHFVAKQLAQLNVAVSRKAHTIDGISAECTVVCYSLRGQSPRFGHWMFDSRGVMQIQKMGLVPHVARGQLVNDIGSALWGQMEYRMLNSSPGNDFEKLWAESLAEIRLNAAARLAKVPADPSDDFL